MTSGPAIRTYREFWPYYLHEHACARTRNWHIGGTCTAGLLLAGAIVLANAWLLLLVAVAGYGPAWCAHILVEKNRPATFQYPLWSLVSDIRMTVSWLTGRLAHELEKAGIADR